jgi:hypothetical protein
MTEQDIRQLIATLKWTFAKTYANKSPHEYVVCKVGEPYRNEVVEFMKYIFDHGETELYFSKPFTVYKIDGRKYWCMAKSKDEISDDNYILNRSMPYNTDTVYK